MDASFLEQLKNLKNLTDEGMNELHQLTASGNAGNGLIKIKLDGNFKVLELEIATDLKLMEKEHLEDYLAVALQQAIDGVSKLREDALMKSVLKGNPFA